MGEAFSYAAGMNPLPSRPLGRAFSRLPGRFAARLALVLALITGLLPGFFGGAEAQEPPVATALMVGQPIYHDLDDTLGLKVRVTNQSEAPLRRLHLQVGFFDRVDNRTVLHETFDGMETAAPFDVVTQKLDDQLEPGESTVVTLDPKLSDGLPSTLEGIYPVSVTLFPDANLDIQLDTFTTAVILYPEPPEFPLNFVLVVPVGTHPTRPPSGHFLPTQDEAAPLELAVAEGGWLRGILDGLDVALDNGLKVGLAPSPRVVEEIADLANGYTKVVGEDVERFERNSESAVDSESVLAQLQTLLSDPGVQPLLSPYASPDLPTIQRELGLEHLTRLLTVGETTLRRLFPDAPFQPNWLFATGARWDAETLEEISLISSGQGGLRTFISAELFNPPIDDTVTTCPDPGIEEAAASFTCPVRIPTTAGSVHAYVRDPDLQDRFTDLAEFGGDALDLQRFFAETATRHLEFPGVPERVTHAILPAHWEARPYTVERLLNGIARAPWITPRKPAQGFAHVVRPQERQLITRASELRGQVDYQQIPPVEQAVDTYADIGAPEGRVARLDRNLLVAMSRSWLSEPPSTEVGLEYITETSREIAEEFAKLSVSGPDTTLTSQRSAIEVNVFNEAAYPVTVDVDFFDQDGDIRIDESDKEELNDLTIDPGEAPAIKVDAIADSSGIFNLEARILSPETGALISSNPIRIRSTNFNQIALGITFGALAFLILFYVLRLTRRRRSARRTAESSAS